MRPLRSKTTYTETLDDEVCVYEWTRHEVHALNATAARVWELCDGKLTIAEMAKRLEAGGLSHTEQLVGLALDEFERKHLLEREEVSCNPRAAVGRRALLRRGVTVALLPVVTSIVAPTPLQAQSPGARSQTFSFTGASETFVVPAGVTALTVSALGAAGRGVIAAGGLGGSVTATLRVTPGETLVVTVGGTPPAPFPLPVLPGFNGGGLGGNYLLARIGGAGGGASDVRRSGAALVNRVVVAGGGGGAGDGSLSATASGGAGGGVTGGSGNPAGIGAAAGGTQTAGGAGAVGAGAGSFGIGGQGAAFGTQVVFSSAGGGGGGGYYGGGGGAGNSGGGGGSSYADPAATGVIHVQGTRAGHGLVVLTWSITS